MLIQQNERRPGQGGRADIAEASPRVAPAAIVILRFDEPRQASLDDRLMPAAERLVDHS
jgi:hypothetical protein